MMLSMMPQRVQKARVTPRLGALSLALMAIVIVLKGGMSFVSSFSGALQQVLASGQPSFRERTGSRLTLLAAGDDYSGMTVADLKEELKSRDLPFSGVKGALIKRLEEDDAKGSGDADAAAPAAAAPAPAPEKPKAKKSSGKPINANDIVYIKGHNGKYIGLRTQGEMIVSLDRKEIGQQFVIEKSPTGPIASGDTVYLKCVVTNFHVDILGSAVRARHNDHGEWQAIVIYRKDGAGPVCDGDTIFLKGHQNAYVDVEGNLCQARWQDQGGWQELTIEL